MERLIDCSNKFEWLKIKSRLLLQKSNIWKQIFQGKKILNDLRYCHQHFLINEYHLLMYTEIFWLIFVSRKSTAILRLKEDKVTKDQSKPASPGRPSSRTGLSMVAADNKEKEELKAIIRNLEEKLKGAWFRYD